MGSIKDKLDALAETKEKIANAIKIKGVNVDATEPFRNYADKIEEISGGGTGMTRLKLKMELLGEPITDLNITLANATDVIVRTTNSAGEIDVEVPPGTYDITTRYGVEDIVTILSGQTIVKTYEHDRISGYGDGSLNTVTNGYFGKVVNYLGEGTTYELSKYYGGNLQADNGLQLAPLLIGAENPNSKHKIICDKTGSINALTTFTWMDEELNAIPVDKICRFRAWCGGSATATVDNAVIKHGGSCYTLEKAVELGIIQPLVIIATASNSGSYLFKSPLNLYAGTKIKGPYPGIAVVFVTKTEIEAFEVSVESEDKSTSIRFDYWNAGYGVFYSEETINGE